MLYPCYPLVVWRRHLVPWAYACGHASSRGPDLRSGYPPSLLTSRAPNHQRGYGRTDRNERREDIKLRLEYVKLAMSLAGMATLIFAGLQWMSSNRIATQAVYQQMATEWREHLRTFADKPNIREYFESSAEVIQADPNYQLVLAVADVRLDTMDAILTYAGLMGYPRNSIQGWRNTFANAFHNSPILCTRLRETETNYGLIVPIAKQACGR